MFSVQPVQPVAVPTPTQANSALQLNLNLNRGPVFTAPAATPPTPPTTTLSNAPTRKRTRDGKRVSFTPSAIDSLVSPSAIDPSLVDPSIDTSPVDPPDNLQGRICQIATAESTICYPRGGKCPAYAKLTLRMAVLKLTPDREVELAGLVQMVLGTTRHLDCFGYKRLIEELKPSAEPAFTCKYLVLLCLA